MILKLKNTNFAVTKSISGFRKKLGKMFFVIKDDNFLQNYDTIWD